MVQPLPPDLLETVQAVTVFLPLQLLQAVTAIHHHVSDSITQLGLNQPSKKLSLQFNKAWRPIKIIILVQFRKMKNNISEQKALHVAHANLILELCPLLLTD